MVKKICFGILDSVFPLGDRGLREVGPECFQCPDRVACLKAALDTREGAELRDGVLERIPAKGVIDRVKRWSRKKALSRIRDREKTQAK